MIMFNINANEQKKNEFIKIKLIKFSYLDNFILMLFKDNIAYMYGFCYR